MNGLVLLLALSTPSVDYGWRVTPEGEVECIIQLEPELVRALLRGEADRTIVRDLIPTTGRPTRFVIQVGDEPLPREAGSAAELIRQVANTERVGPGSRPAAEPGTLDPPAKILQLAHVDTEDFSGQRTVFETQLQLRRGEADTSFELKSTPPRSSLPQYGAGAASTTDWNQRTAPEPSAGAASQFTLSDSNSTVGAGSRIGDDSRYGSAGSIGDRYAASPTTEPRVVAPQESPLQIRYGDDPPTSQPSRFSASPAAAAVETPTSRFSAPPLDDSRYAAQPSRDASRFAPTNDQSTYGGTDPRYGATPQYEAPARSELPYTPPARETAVPSTAPYARTAMGATNAGADPRGYAANPQFPPDRYAASRTSFGAGDVARQADPRIAARQEYGGPFSAGGFGGAANPSTAALPNPKTIDDKLGETDSTDKSDTDKVVAEPQWGPLVMTLFALMASLSGNAYLGHMAWGIYRRYRVLTDELRSTPDFGSSSSYDDEDSSSVSAPRGRRRRSRLAARY